MGIRVVKLTSSARDWIRSGAVDKIRSQSIKACQKKLISKLKKVISSFVATIEKIT